MTEATLFLPGLSPVGGKTITATFDGGKLSSNGGVLILREIEKKLGLAAVLSRHIRKCARQGGIAERKAMIDRDHDLPLTRQAAVLNISRGSLYYKPRPVSAADLALMRRMDELHLEFPFA